MLYNKDIFKRYFRWHGKYWYMNIVEIPKYFKSIHFLVKHGYDNYALWETFTWFTKSMKSILTDYKNTRCGTPILIDDYPFSSNDNSESAKLKRKENDDLWESIIDQMIALLDDMDESNPKYDNMDIFEQDKLMADAKNKFFALFSEHFYRLWD